MSGDIHILQNGVPRSGNIWLFNQVRRCLEASGVCVRQHVDNDQVAHALAKRDLGIRHIAENDFLTMGPSGAFYNILDVYRWPIADVDAYISSTTQVASHSPWYVGAEDLYQRFSHVLYVVRDPRDVALSLAKFAFTPFNQLQRPTQFDTPQAYLRHRLHEMIGAWVEHVQGHLANFNRYNGHVLFYEKMVSDPMAELQRLAAFLGLSLSEQQCREVIGDTSFEKIKQQQPQHTDRGGWGRWREELGRSQIRTVETIAGPLMAQLGYPLAQDDTADWQPRQLSGLGGG